MKIFKLQQDLLGFKKGYVINQGLLGKLPWGWEIPESIMIRNPNWFEDISLQFMNTDQKIAQIKKHFSNLKEAHLWCMENFPSEVGLTGGTSDPGKLTFLMDKLLPALEKEYSQLEKLGVSKEFSSSLFIFGSSKLVELAEQFK